MMKFFPSLIFLHQSLCLVTTITTGKTDFDMQIYTTTTTTRTHRDCPLP